TWSEGRDGGWVAAKASSLASVKRLACGSKCAGVGRAGSMRRNAPLSLPANRCMSANEWTSKLIAGAVTRPLVLGDPTEGTALMAKGRGATARKANCSLIHPRSKGPHCSRWTLLSFHDRIVVTAQSLAAFVFGEPVRRAP